MTQTLLLVLAVAFAALLVVGIAFLVRRTVKTQRRLGQFFNGKATRRLAVIEQTSVDARRSLLLIRRDDVEHLVLTGGPVDIVIESGIGAPPVQGDPGRETSARIHPPYIGHLSGDG